jgi:hypothetical protein
MLAALLLLGCTGKPAPPHGTPDREATSPTIVRIVFDLPGDDIGGPEAQALLDEVKAAIIEKRAGEILRTGFSMGEMEIVLQHHGDDATDRIRQAIDAVRPGAKYRIVRDAR